MIRTAGGDLGRHRLVEQRARRLELPARAVDVGLGLQRIDQIGVAGRHQLPPGRGRVLLRRQRLVGLALAQQHDGQDVQPQRALPPRLAGALERQLDEAPPRHGIDRPAQPLAQHVEACGQRLGDERVVLGLGCRGRRPIERGHRLLVAVLPVLADAAQEQRTGQERRPGDPLGDAGRLLGQRQRAIALAERVEGLAARERLLGRRDLLARPGTRRARHRLARIGALCHRGQVVDSGAGATRHDRVACGQRVEDRGHLDEALIEAAHPAIEQDRRAGALAAVLACAPARPDPAHAVAIELRHHAIGGAVVAGAADGGEAGAQRARAGLVPHRVDRRVQAGAGRPLSASEHHRRRDDRDDAGRARRREQPHRPPRRQRVDERVDRLEAIGRVEGQGAADGGADWPRHRRVRRLRADRAGLDRGRQLAVGAAVERSLAVERAVQRAAQRPLIGAGVDDAAGVLLGRHEGGRAHRGPGLGQGDVEGARADVQRRPARPPSPVASSMACWPASPEARSRMTPSTAPRSMPSPPAPGRSRSRGPRRRGR